ncbi:MAG TPA: hypothetical protein PK400_09430, partial [Phycisphaerales bacterium]|nr:hypothetical protein [Phycisphaerales bacterium]
MMFTTSAQSMQNCTPAWQAFGDVNGMVRQLAMYDGDLIAAGSFTEAGGVPVSYIARWDGTQWHALAGGVNDNQVLALIQFNGDLIAAGAFTEAGGVPVGYIARWDGVQWHAMDTGMNGFVNCLAVHNGYLIAGGEFTTASGETVHN